MSSKFLDYNKNINIEEIMKEIRKNISERYSDENEVIDEMINEISFENGKLASYSFHDLLINVEYNNFNWQTFQDQIPHKNRLWGLEKLFKKVLRKLFRWYVIPTFQNQNEFNGSITRSINELTEISKTLNSNVNELRGNLKKIESILLKSTTETQNKIKKLEEKLAEVTTESEEKTKKLENKFTKLATESENEIKKIDDKLIKITTEIKNNINKLNNDMNDTYTQHLLYDYSKFEMRFRGSEEQIKEHMQFYIPYFENKKNVLDIGFGRGEFLTILKEKDINCAGVDINEQMVKKAKEKGLNVFLDDGISFLEKQEDSCYDGIMICQVVEHLRNNELIKLLKLAYKKMAKGGILVIETINPMCLSIFGRSFYIDLTHQKPIHPFTLEFLLKEIGFEKIEIVFLSQIDNSEHIAFLPNPNNDVDIKKFNESMKRLNEIIFGFQDYAIIAKK